MSQREKRVDKIGALLVASVGLVIAVRDYQDRKEKEELQLENQRLRNTLLQKELDKTTPKIIMP